MRRAKIVCTLGPATSSPRALRALVDAGMDVARLNLSHGDLRRPRAGLPQRARRRPTRRGRGVGILVDLQGPKIRLGTFAAGRSSWSPGDAFTITTDDVPGDDDLRVGRRTRACPATSGPATGPDRRRQGRAAGARGRRPARRDHGRRGRHGLDHKGINLPGVAVSVPALSEKDVDDLRWALRLRRRPDRAVVRAQRRRHQRRARGSWTRRASGCRCSPRSRSRRRSRTSRRSSRRSTAIMVARGDLGVELPLEDVPLVQKRAVELARGPPSR